MAINPIYTASRRPEWDIEAMAQGLIAGDRGALSRSITLVESQRSADLSPAAALLERVAQLQKSALGRCFRLGITGNPGAGKSTLIEALGQQWVAQGHRVAVLAIDPSSTASHGSILGDKTRMESLARLPEAYIRPSPYSGTLGGIHAHSHEVLSLFEAAGFDRIMIETVGIGQNETSVQTVVDFTLLIALPGAGDEVQGLKRGVMEAADQIWVNKSDGDRITAAQQTKSQLAQVIGLFHREDGWTVPIQSGSAIEATSIALLLEALEKGFQWGIATGRTETRRKDQQTAIFQQQVQRGLWQLIEDDPKLLSHQKEIQEGRITPRKARLEFLRDFMAKYR